MLLTALSGKYKIGDTIEVISSAMRTMILLICPMAPEIYRGEAFSANIDTYSLGLVMYELLNGKRIPFLREDDTHRGFPARQAALSRRLSGEPLPKIPGVSSSLQSVILKACAFDPTKRFPSPLEMRQALEEL